jgi:putative spermidine/putrescine transport system permease protein
MQVYLLLPFTIPLVVSGIGMMLIFGEMRVLGSALAGRRSALCAINLPFIIWAVSASAAALDSELENAAAELRRDAGARCSSPSPCPRVTPGDHHRRVC